MRVFLPDATVYLNGSVIGRNFCGYNSFVVDATDMALYGDQVNDLVVFVDATQIEGWWYEGAGIYRHVNLYKKNKLHIAHWGVFVHPIRKTVDVWDAATDTTIENSSYENKNFRLKTYILDKEDNIVGKDEKEFSVAGGSKTEVNQSILTYSPLLWDIDAPNLYTMVSELYENDSLVDSQKNTFGFRTIAINKDKGFFLNGRHVPLYGTCNHQDHAGVGVAVPDSVNEYRIKLLKEMGSNAYRCAHGNPNPEILDYCDKYGIRCSWTKTVTLIQVPTVSSKCRIWLCVTEITHLSLCTRCLTKNRFKALRQAESLPKDFNAK